MSVTIGRPRNPKTVVLEAELAASSPERVRIWLEETAKEESLRLYGRDENIERTLLERADPLITLLLAQLASNSKIVRAIHAGAGRENKAVRLALLMNEAAGKAYVFGMPDVLLGDRKVEAFLSALDVEEVAALFSNPTLRDSFLIDFFEQKGPWQALDDDRRFIAVQALRSNPRMQSKYDGPYDGWAEHTHNRVFSAAWELAGKVPATVEWAAPLGWLYDKLPTRGLSVEKPLQLAVRWVATPSDTERLELERKDLERGDLGVFAQMRKGIARLSVASASTREARRALATHEDPALRAALYSDGALTIEEMKEADERDPMLSFNQMMWNPCVWRTKEHRAVLRAMAWDSKRDPKAYMDPQNMFNACRERYRREHPAWFTDDDVDEANEALDLETQPPAGGDLSSTIERMKGELLTGNELARATHAAILKVSGRISWLGWGVAAVLALLLLRNH